MSWPARYPGTCANCGERFNKDDLIHHFAGSYAHDACDDDVTIDVDRPACTRCWLVHAAGQDDCE